MGGASLEGLVDAAAEGTLHVRTQCSFERGHTLLSVHTSLLCIESAFSVHSERERERERRRVHTCQ